MVVARSSRRFFDQARSLFAAGNLSTYYSTRQRRSKDFRGPDFFVVLDTEYKERKSWVVWEEEGRYPNLILEILSDSTAEIDRGLKKQIYQDIFRTPEYFWFEPFTLELKGFHWRDAVAYADLSPNEQGWLWSQQLELYLGVVEEKLRFLTADGEVVPAPKEVALLERQRADQAGARAQVAEAKAERLRRKLEELGIDLDD